MSPWIFSVASGSTAGMDEPMSSSSLKICGIRNAASEMQQAKCRMHNAFSIHNSPFNILRSHRHQAPLHPKYFGNLRIESGSDFERE